MGGGMQSMSGHTAVNQARQVADNIRGKTETIRQEDLAARQELSTAIQLGNTDAIQSAQENLNNVQKAAHDLNQSYANYGVAAPDFIQSMSKQHASNQPPVTVPMSERERQQQQNAKDLQQQKFDDVYATGDQAPILDVDKLDLYPTPIIDESRLGPYENPSLSSIVERHTPIPNIPNTPQQQGFSVDEQNTPESDINQDTNKNRTPQIPPAELFQDKSFDSPLGADTYLKNYNLSEVYESFEKDNGQYGVRPKPTQTDIEQNAPESNVNQQPPKSYDNEVASQINKAFTNMSQGAQDDALDQVASYIENGREINFTKPDAIQQALENPNYNIAPNDDGSVRVLGVKKSDGTWVGIEPTQSTDISQQSPSPTQSNDLSFADRFRDAHLNNPNAKQQIIADEIATGRPRHEVLKEVGDIVQNINKNKGDDPPLPPIDPPTPPKTPPPTPIEQTPTDNHQGKSFSNGTKANEYLKNNNLGDSHEAIKSDMGTYEIQPKTAKSVVDQNTSKIGILENTPILEQQKGDIGRASDNAPFLNRQAANLAQKGKKLNESHDIVEVGKNKFVLRPKIQDSNNDVSNTQRVEESNATVPTTTVQDITGIGKASNDTETPVQSTQDSQNNQHALNADDHIQFNQDFDYATKDTQYRVKTVSKTKVVLENESGSTVSINPKVLEIERSKNPDLYRKVEKNQKQSPSTQLDIETDFGLSLTHHVPTQLFDTPQRLGDIAQIIAETRTEGVKTDAEYGQNLLKTITALNPDVQIHFVSDLNKISDQKLRGGMKAGGYYLPEQNLLYIYPNSTVWESSALELVNHELVHTITAKPLFEGQVDQNTLDTLQGFRDKIKDYSWDSKNILAESIRDRFDYLLHNDPDHELLSVSIAETEVRTALKNILGKDGLQKLDNIFKQISNLKDRRNEQSNSGNQQSGTGRKNESVSDERLPNTDTRTTTTVQGNTRTSNAGKNKQGDTSDRQSDLLRNEEKQGTKSSTIEKIDDSVEIGQALLNDIATYERFYGPNRIIIVSEDTALFGANNRMGQPVYLGVKAGKGRTNIDISAFTNQKGLFTENELKNLKDAAENAEAKQRALASQYPNGVFSDTKNQVVTSESIDPKLGQFLESLLKSMKIDSKVFLFYRKDVVKDGAVEKYKIYGGHRSILSAGKSSLEQGSTRLMSIDPNDRKSNDFYISLSENLDANLELEIIAHELGHIIEKKHLKNADLDTQKAIKEEFNKWLIEHKDKSVNDYVSEMRNRNNAESTIASNPNPNLNANELSPYWRSFSEWFADQVSRWVTTSDKPLSLVEKFFSKIAEQLKKLAQIVTGKDSFQPNNSVKNYLDSLTNIDIQPNLFLESEVLDDVQELDSRSGSPLEGTPAEDVRGVQEQGDSDAETRRSSRTDLSGSGQPRTTGNGPERSVADGEREVSDPTRRTDSNNGLDPQQAVVADNAPVDAFVIDENHITQGGKKTKFRANIAAIRVLRTLEAENRPATKEEQKILSGFVGWGGLPEAFKREDGSISTNWTKEVAELEALLTPQEMQAAVDSSIAAHYTSPEIVKALWKALENFGFKKGLVLEPAVGVGNFFGLMPKGMRKASKLHAVELDNITGAIAQYLYPEANIKAAMGFQDYQTIDGYFDVAIGNPPFSNIPITDKTRPSISGFSLHNYFFAKSIDSLKPNGVLAMVVTNRFMDKLGDKERSYISDRAELVGAIRLPNDAFLSNAGTQVTTDIIFLRKKADGETKQGETWLDVKNYTDKDGNTVPLNEYFVRHPENMIGDFGAYGTMYRDGEPALIKRDGQDTGKLLNELVDKLPKDIFQAEESQNFEETRQAVIKDISEVKIGAMFVNADGSIHERLPDVMGEYQSKAVEFTNPKAESRVKGMIAAAEQLAKLRTLQLDRDATDSQINIARKKLNTIYDEFYKEHGYLNSDANKRLMRDDPNWAQISSLENNYDRGVSAQVAKSTGQKFRKPSAEKAAIFSKRTQVPAALVKKVGNAKDALTESLNRHGFINTNTMQNLYGKDADEIIKELGDLVYDNPINGYEVRDEYLSGNVKQKLAVAKEYAAKDPKYQRNVHALEKVIPADIEALDIDVKVGSHWIPNNYIADFVNHITGSKTATANYGKYSNKWEIDKAVVSPAAEATYATDRADVKTILTHALNGTKPTIYDRFSDGTSVINHDATLEASQRVELVKQSWKDWLWDNDARREHLERLYNDVFNATVNRSYDGSHLTFHGMNTTIELRPHQKNAIWRTIQSKSTLYDHTVGAGKTFTAIASAMEMRRMGIVNKPMLVVPNHLVGQWAKDFILLYPNANILAATKADFEKGNRKKFIAKIANGDYDAIIIAHSSFGKLSISPEQEQAFIDNEIAELMAFEAELKAEKGGRSRNAKDIAKRRLSLEEKKKGLLNSENKDGDNIYWHETGVDAIIVDEAQEFKNLEFTTSMKNVAGLGTGKGSQRAKDLFAKIQLMQQNNAKSKVIFATGTPISNTMAEMFTMQRYLAWNELEQQGISHFDAWAKSLVKSSVIGSCHLQVNINSTTVLPSSLICLNSCKVT